MEVTYNKTLDKFRITITTDGELRIKVPEVMRGSKEEAEWIDRCKQIKTRFIIPPFYTLRGTARGNVLSNFSLRRGKGNAYKVVGTQLRLVPRTTEVR